MLVSRNRVRRSNGEFMVPEYVGSELKNGIPRRRKPGTSLTDRDH